MKLFAPISVIIWITLAASLCIFGGGCGSTGKAGASSDYVQSFKAGRYADAYEASSKASLRASGFQRDQAALIAGLSAQALNRNEDAEKHLTPLVGNADPRVAGEAGAALGLIAAEQGKHEKAAELLMKAGRKLENDQAARAFMYAGDSYKSLGKPFEARGMWSLAQTKVASDASLRVMIGDRLSAGTTSPAPPKPTTTPGAVQFTVQVGAFSSFTNAQKQLGRFRAWGSPRVVEMNRGGKQMFVVRVGNYATRAEADRIKKSIGKEATVMTTAGE